MFHDAQNHEDERRAEGPLMESQQKSVRRFAMLALSNVVAVAGILGIAVYFFWEIENGELVLRTDALASVGEMGKTDRLTALRTSPARSGRLATAPAVELKDPDMAIDAEKLSGSPRKAARIIPPPQINTASKSDALNIITKEVVARRITPQESFDLASAAPDKPYPLEDLARRKAQSVETPVKQQAKAPVKPKQETAAERKNRLMLAKLKHKEREQYCLAAAVYYESAYEPRRGKEAVAQVIMNRKASKRYPNTVCGVVFQNDHMKNRCQFSFACDGRSDRPKKNKPWRQAEQVAKSFLVGGKRVSALKDVTHYHADYVRPKWASSLTRVSKIGRHIFYKIPPGGDRVRVASISRRLRNGYRIFKFSAPSRLFKSTKTNSKPVSARLSIASDN